MSDTAREQFEGLLYRLKRAVVLGRAHVAIGLGILHNNTLNAEIDGFAPTFWQLSVDAHLDSANLLACKLFDGDSRTATVKHLLKAAEKQNRRFQYATPEQVRKIVTAASIQIKNLDPVLKPVVEWRNEVLAHAPLAVRSMGRQAAHLDQVLSVAGEIVDEVSRAFRGDVFVFDYLKTDDYQKILDLITRTR